MPKWVRGASVISAGMILCGLGLVVLIMMREPAKGGKKPEFQGQENVDARPFTIRGGVVPGQHIGKLIWAGGLILSSADPRFGGYSGLALDRSGSRLLAISDRGTWLSARLIARDGQPLGLEDARIGALPVRKSAHRRGKRGRDSESLAHWPGAKRRASRDPLAGDYLIAFEGFHRIEHYAFDGKRMRLIGGLALPKAVRHLPANQGLEGIEVLEGGSYKGAAIALAEHSVDKRGDFYGWLIERGKAPARIGLHRSDDFDVTGLAALPDGGLLVLERKFLGIFGGIYMRIRRVAPGAIKPGARLDGEVLFTSRPGDFIDNMEGIAVHRQRSGKMLITIISDDNFNRAIQNTMLMRFILP